MIATQHVPRTSHGPAQLRPEEYTSLGIPNGFWTYQQVIVDYAQTREALSFCIACVLSFEVSPVRCDINPEDDRDSRPSDNREDLLEGPERVKACQDQSDPSTDISDK